MLRKGLKWLGRVLGTGKWGWGTEGDLGAEGGLMRGLEWLRRGERRAGEEAYHTL